MITGLMMVGQRRRASGPAPPVTTWDAATKGAAITLSAANMQAEKATTGFQSVYGTVGKSTGKWQFEIKHLAVVGVNGPIFGIGDKANTANMLSSHPGRTVDTVFESIGWAVGATMHRRLTATTSAAAFGTSSALNDIITVTLDLTLGTPEAKFYLNGSLMSSAVTLPTGKTWYPIVGLRSGGKVGLTPAALVHPQSGFSDWG